MTDVRHHSPRGLTPAIEGGDAGGDVGGHSRPPERHRQPRPDRRRTAAGGAP